MGKVLVVDDSSMVRSTVRNALEKAGYLVCDAEDGQDAYDIFLEDDIDVVVTDLVMPKCDGFELIERIRLSDHSVPIIVLTTAAGEPNRDIAIDVGADGYLVKPFKEDALIDELRCLLTCD